MIRQGAFWFLILLSVRGWSQQGKFSNLRYDDDFSFLKADTMRSFYDKIKFTPLNRSATCFLSIGGEVRYQPQYFKNEDWGDADDDSYIAFYTRFLFHTDLHLSKHFRLFTQLNSTFANGRPTPNRTIDENRFGLHQLFADWNILNAETVKLVLRVGRQELLYGSQRIISVREGPNNRLSFDAAKIFFTARKFKADIFYARPVRIGQDVFDDRYDENRQLGSFYSTISAIPELNVDLYYIGYYNQQSVFNEGVSEEVRHSIGTRIWNKTGSWDYDIEGLFQFGSFGSGKIIAHTASANVTYTFIKAKCKPSLGVKTEIISGDKEHLDGDLNTFNPLFPRGAYFGLAALIGPANLIDFHPSFNINLSRTVSFMLDYDLFWRQSTSDGIYGPNGALLYSENGDERHIGNQLGTNLEYQPNRHLTITPEFTWFSTGSYLKEVSAGKNVFFAAITLQLKY